MKPIILAAALAVILTAGFCNQTKTPAQMAVGEWREKGDDSYITFRADQTVSMGGKALGLKLEVSGTYTFIESNKVKIETNGLAALAGPLTFTIAFPDETTMTLKNEATGKSRTYRKAPTP